jgi:hypothetical protein
MNAVEATKDTLGLVHEYIEATIEDCQPETATRILPNATIGSIGAIYIHSIAQEDWAIKELIQGKPKLIDSGNWYERFGVAAPNPGESVDWSKSNHDLAAFREFAKEVYKATDDYLASIQDSDLDKQIEWFGQGTRSASWVIADTIHAHHAFHAGEIAALKGVMGLKGLPW